MKFVFARATGSLKGELTVKSNKKLPVFLELEIESIIEISFVESVGTVHRSVVES